MNNTRKRLVASLLAMAMCFTMLIGSTFAWFTDTASTSVNTIVSGNLDMVVEYLKADGSWEEVDSNTQLFKDGALFEPGYTEVAYLKISNNGNLAFTYEMAVNAANEKAGTNIAGTEFKLSEHLKMGVVESDSVIDYTDRTAALEAVKDSAKEIETYTNSFNLLPEEFKYIAIVVYMPETVGNDANHNGTDVPSIELGVTVNAKQMAHESDSFNNQYDANAEYDKTDSPVSSDEELTAVIESKKDYVVGDGEYKKTVVSDNNTVIINGGTFKNQVIAARNGGTVIVNNATVGSVEAGGGPNVIANVNSGSKVVINGGSYLTNTILYGDGTGTVEITGGYFDCGSLYINFYGKPIANLTITGGTFSSMMVMGQGLMGPNISDFVPATHQIINNTDGSITVVAK